MVERKYDTVVKAIDLNNYTLTVSFGPRSILRTFSLSALKSKGIVWNNVARGDIITLGYRPTADSLTNSDFVQIEYFAYIEPLESPDVWIKNGF